MVPQIDGLTVEDFIKFARQSPERLKYLPNDQDWNHVDKKWLCDILYTVDADAFTELVNKAVRHRKEK